MRRAAVSVRCRTSCGRPASAFCSRTARKSTFCCRRCTACNGSSSPGTRAARSSRCRHSTSAALAPSPMRRPKSATRRSNSSLPFTTISAAALGVGARTSATKSLKVQSISCPTAEMTGICRAGDGPHHDFLVEAPQILETAAAAPHDQHIEPAAPVQQIDGRGDFFGRARPLHPYRRQHHVQIGESAVQYLQDVADGRARRRGHEAHVLGQQGQGFLALGSKQPFGGKFLLERLEAQHQFAFTGGLDLLQQNLVVAAGLVNGDLTESPDQQAVAQGHRHAGQRPAEHHRPQLTGLVLEREISMARGGAAKIRNFAFDPDAAKGPFQRALDAPRQLRNLPHLPPGIGAFG